MQEQAKSEVEKAEAIKDKVPSPADLVASRLAAAATAAAAAAAPLTSNLTCALLCLVVMRVFLKWPMFYDEECASASLSCVPYEPSWPCVTDLKGNVILIAVIDLCDLGCINLFARGGSPFQWSALSTCVRVTGRSLTHAAAGTVPMKAVTTQLQSAAAAGHSTAVATLATVTAAMQATWDPERGKKVGGACMPVL